MTHNTIKAQIDASTVAQLVDIFPPGEDEELLWQAIRNSTNFEEALAALLDDMAEAETMESACAARIADLTERKRRFGKRGDRAREMIAELMRMANIRKAEFPEATLSISNRAPSLIITDESALPGEYLRQPPPAPDKRAITDALKAGEIIPGATLSNGSESLTIRRK